LSKIKQPELVYLPRFTRYIEEVNTGRVSVGPGVLLSVSASGTSPVTLSTLFSRLLSVSKSTDANGDFFIFDSGASDAHIGYIGRYDDDSHFKRLQLMFVPSAQTILELRFRYAIPKLVLDEQAPPGDAPLPGEHPSS
jgi:hypothetical protein